MSGVKSYTEEELSNKRALLHAQFGLYKSKYQNLLDKYESRQGGELLPSEMDEARRFSEQLKEFHAELEALAKLCRILEINDQTPHPELKMDLLEINLMYMSFEEYSKSEEGMDQKAKQLAELLFSCLQDEVKSADNPISFLSKMKVFPRITALAKVDNSLNLNLLKIIAKTMKNLGDMYMASIEDLRNKTQVQSQNVRVMQQNAIFVFATLQRFGTINAQQAITTLRQYAIEKLAMLNQSAALSQTLPKPKPSSTHTT